MQLDKQGELRLSNLTSSSLPLSKLAQSGSASPGGCACSCVPLGGSSIRLYSVVVSYSSETPFLGRLDYQACIFLRRPSSRLHHSAPTKFVVHRVLQPVRCIVIPDESVSVAALG